MIRIRSASPPWRPPTRFFVYAGLIWFALGLAPVLVPGQELQVMPLVVISLVILVFACIAYARRKPWKFHCLDCHTEVGEPLPTEGYDGESAPVFRPCSRCNLLWYLGSASPGTAQRIPPSERA